MRHAKRRRVGPWKGAAFVALLALALVRPALPARDGKPNILVIWGDDIGYWNISAYNQGNGLLRPTYRTFRADGFEPRPRNWSPARGRPRN